MTPQSNVFHGDCMDFMRQFPDGYFDLGVIDPPYGLGGAKLTNGGTWAAKYQKTAHWDTKPPPEYFTELFRVTKNQIIWGGNYFDLPVNRCYIIWDKLQYVPTMSDCEYAWCSLDKNAKIVKYCRNTTEKRIHVTQKPIALYEWILRNYAKPGDKILDTHMGSQSSRIAAYKLGFDYWGSELDADYFRNGCARFEKEIAMPLFDAIQQPKQEKLFV